MTAATELEPVVKTVEVGVAPDRAFQIFTERISEWWPKARHSIGENEVADIAVEPRIGGRIYERWHDGTEYDWGIFTAWDPPHRLAMDWRPVPTSGPTTEVDVTFSPSPAGTLVELTHRGWERLGDSAAEARRSYDDGWVGVLALYEASTS